MDSQAIKELWSNTRTATERYLNRECTDRILGELLINYHILLTDAELLQLVEPREMSGGECCFWLPPHERRDHRLHVLLERLRRMEQILDRRSPRITWILR